MDAILTLGMCVVVHTPTLLCDNLSVVARTHNLALHARTKNIELGIHFVHELTIAKQILGVHVPTIDQVVDFFTQFLSPSNFQAIRFTHKSSQACNPL